MARVTIRKAVNVAGRRFEAGDVVDVDLKTLELIRDCADQGELVEMGRKAEGLAEAKAKGLEKAIEEFVDEWEGGDPD